MMLSIVLELLRPMRRTAVSHPSYPFKVMGHVVGGRIQWWRTNANVVDMYWKSLKGVTSKYCAR